MSQKIYPRPLAEAQLDSLKRRAQVEPQARMDLAAYAKIMDHGSDETITDLMYGDDSRWRLNTDHLTNPVADWDDFAAGTDGSWILNQRSLQHANRGISAEVFDPAMRTRLVEDWIRNGSTGIMGWADPIRVESATVQDGSNSFVMVVRNQEGRSRLQGRLRTSQRSGDEAILVETISVETQDGRFTPLVKFEDWRRNEVMGGEFAHKMIFFEPDGREAGRIEFMEIMYLDVDLDRAVRRPRPDEEDMFRGALTFTSITDHSRSELTRVDLRTRSLGETIGVESASQRSYRTAGLLGGVLAIGVLIVVRVFVKTGVKGEAP